MLVEFGIDDGYQVNGREFTAEVSDEDLADCPTLECAQNVISAAIQEEFEERVSWHSDAMDPDQARALWEAAKAAQEATMTRDEWKALYYPVPATEACGTALEAAEHSLRKWRGLAAHPMAGYAHSDKCALCQFSKIKKNDKIPECARCPLVQSGHLDCTELRSAWYAWADGDCGQRIIRELEETVEWCKKQEDEHAGK